MILLQQLKVLPAGAMFQVFDMHKEVLRGIISRTDKTCIFHDTATADLYYKVYSVFHVTLLSVELVDTDDVINPVDGVVFVISVR